MTRGAIHAGRWLLPALALLVALVGFPFEPVQDGDSITLPPVSFDTAPPTATPLPTATTEPERGLLVVDEPTPTTAPETAAEPTATAPPAATATPIPVPAIADTVRATARRRATIAHDALIEHYYLPDERLYREKYPNQHWFPYSYAWPLSQVLGLSNDMAGWRDADPQRVFDIFAVVTTLEMYFDESGDPPAYTSYIQPPYGPESHRYYDDNVWLGLELVRAYEATNYPLALQRAGQLFDFMVTGWHDDESEPGAGGIYWIESPEIRIRNTVSTAPAIELGLLLYELESDPERREYYYEWSLRMYDWLEEHMRSPDGLYWDHMRPDGEGIDTMLFTYNQGAMIGANVLLYRVTGHEQFLDRAAQTAQAALDHWEGDRLFDQEIAFNALFFQDLLLLNTLRPDQRYLDALVAYVDTIWSEQRDPRTGLHTTSQPLTLLDQVAATRLYAMIAGYSSDGR